MFAYYHRSIGALALVSALLLLVASLHLQIGTVAGIVTLITGLALLPMGICYLSKPYLGLLDYRLEIYSIWGQTIRSYPIQYLELEGWRVLVRYRNQKRARLPIRSIWIRPNDWEGILLALEMMISFRQNRSPALPDGVEQELEHQRT